MQMISRHNQIGHIQSRSNTMGTLDIFAGGDMERPRAWLRTVLLPVLADRQHMESRGFKASFVQRFDKKHSRMLRFDGTIARKVRGVNEIEFLRGVAESLGVRPFEDDWDPRDTVTTTAVARQCLEVLARMESGRGPDVLAVQTPGVATETTTSVTGAES